MTVVIGSAGAFARIQSTDDQASLNLPIIFATDRERECKDGGMNYTRQMLEPADGMNYGIRRVDIEAPSPAEEELACLKNWGWTAMPYRKRKRELEAIAAPVVPPDFSESVFEKDGQAKLVEITRKALAESGRKELLIYVHGCCLDFDESMRQSAALEEAVKAPVVAYCWGCTKGNYAGSLLAYPRTQERFNDFMVAMLKAFPTEKISVVANSIGNSLLINFALQRRIGDTGRMIDNIFMSRADVDDFAFKSQLKYMRAHSRNIILYVAKNDPQINISGVLRWFSLPSQHGERVGNSRSALQSEPSLIVLDVSPLKMGHVIPYHSISDIIDNHGVVPDRSERYEYTRGSDNLVRVTPIVERGTKASNDTQRSLRGAECHGSL